MGTFLRTFLRTRLMFSFFKLGVHCVYRVPLNTLWSQHWGEGMAFDAARQIREAQASQRKRWLQATWTCTWRKAARACGPKGLNRTLERRTREKFACDCPNVKNLILSNIHILAELWRV